MRCYTYNAQLAFVFTDDHVDAIFASGVVVRPQLTKDLVHGTCWVGVWISPQAVGGDLVCCEGQRFAVVKCQVVAILDVPSGFSNGPCVRWRWCCRAQIKRCRRYAPGHILCHLDLEPRHHHRQSLRCLTNKPEDESRRRLLTSLHLRKVNVSSVSISMEGK